MSTRMNTLAKDVTTGILDSYRKYGNHQQGIDLNGKTIIINTLFRRDPTAPFATPGNSMHARVPAYISAKEHDSEKGKRLDFFFYSVADPAFWSGGVLKTQTSNQERQELFGNLKGKALYDKIQQHGLETETWMSNSPKSWEQYLTLHTGDALAEHQSTYVSTINATKKGAIEDALDTFLMQVNGKYNEILSKDDPNSIPSYTGVTDKDLQHFDTLKTAYSKMTPQFEPRR